MLIWSNLSGVGIALLAFVAMILVLIWSNLSGVGISENLATPIIKSVDLVEFVRSWNLPIGHPFEVLRVDLVEFVRSWNRNERPIIRT